MVSTLEMASSSKDIIQSLVHGDVITLNVGGERHQVSRRTLASQPDTRLGKLQRATDLRDIANLCDSVSLPDNEFFFDRPPKSFQFILNFHRTGCLHVVEGLCPVAFKEDLEYWEVNEENLSPCCQVKYLDMTEEAERDRQIVDKLKKKNEKLLADNESWFAKRWLLKKTYSCVVKVLTWLSLLNTLILLSVRTMASVLGLDEIEDNKTDAEGYTKEKNIFSTVEKICISFIAAQYTVRLLASSQKLRYITRIYSLVDMLIVVSYSFQYLNFYYQIVFLHVLNVIKIFKSRSSSPGVHGVLNASMSTELFAVLLILASEALVLGNAAFYFEKDEPSTGFTSSFEGFWWAAITLATMGYDNEVKPVTQGGKLIGFLCCVGSLMALVLLMAAVNRRYNDSYKQRMENKRDEKRGTAIGLPPQAEVGEVEVKEG